MIGGLYLERGELVMVRCRWGKGGGPRNVLVERASGEVVVRPFRGLRRTQDDEVAVARAWGRAKRLAAPAASLALADDLMTRIAVYAAVKAVARDLTERIQTPRFARGFVLRRDDLFADPQLRLQVWGGT